MITKFKTATWVHLATMYILLTPISKFIPPIPIGIDINFVRFIVFALFVELIRTFIFQTSRSWSRNKTIICGLFGIYALSIIFHASKGLFPQLKNSFTMFSLLTFWSLFSLKRKLPSFSYWAHVFIISAIISFSFAYLVTIGALGIPIYRADIANVFSAGSRTASIVDSTPGIWACVGALFFLSTAKSWHHLVWGFGGIFIGSASIILGQYRIFLALVVFILLSWVISPWFKKAQKKSKIIFLFFLIPLLLLNMNILKSMSVIQRFQSLQLNIEQTTIGSSQWAHHEEILKELKLIREAPFLGHGWDVTDRFFVGTRYYGYLNLYGHCLYTALPARIGIIFTSIYFFFIVVIIKNRLTAKLDGNYQYMIQQKLCLLGIVCFLLGSLSQNILAMSQTSVVLGIFIVYSSKKLNQQ